MRSFRFLMLGPALAVAGFACGSQEVEVDVPAASPMEQAPPGEAMQQERVDEQLEMLRQGREQMMQENASGNPAPSS